MYLAFYVSATLGVAGLTFAVLAYVSDRPVERRHGVLLGALSGTAVLLAVSIAAALRFAQPTVCRTLGGEWLAHRGHICWNEWGGNGINDAGAAPWPFDTPPDCFWGSASQRDQSMC